MGEAARRNALGLPPRGNNMQIQIDGDSLKDRVCDCGGKVFTNAFSLKELPALQSPSGQMETVMAQVGFVCVTCGLVIPLRPEKPKVELVAGGIDERG
jgi:hypothetical protein